MINKKKLIFSALALATGISVVGSVTTTIAWYQYSTRANVAYVGSSAGTSGNLQLRIKQDGALANENWTTQLTKEAVAEYLDSEGYDADLVPVTPKLSDETRNASLEKENDEPVFYDMIKPKQANPEKWKKAEKGAYISFPLELRFVSRDTGTEVNIEKDVYLSDLLIQEDHANEIEDISDAVRVHLTSSNVNEVEKSFLISKNGGTTVTHGRLDLDGVDGIDKAFSDVYGFNSELEDVIYGEDGQYVSYCNGTGNELITGKKYYDELTEVMSEENPTIGTGAWNNPLVDEPEGIAPIVAQKVEDHPFDLENLTFGDDDESKSVGTTLSGDSAFLTIDVTIWVEGWHQFAEENYDNSFAVWEPSNFMLGAIFDVGLQFAVDYE